MNVLTIAGHLGNDAEVRHTTTGTAITSFSLPVEQGWGDNKKTTWVKCTLFGKKGTGDPHGLTPHLTKGRFVAVTGEMVLDEWESKGEKHAQVACIVRDTKLGPPKEGQQSGSHPAANQARPTGAAQSVTDDFEDSDIPF